MANLSRIESNAKIGRRERAVKCPRCGTVMDEVARIAPSLGDPGLIGYVCPNCVYVTSEMLQPSVQHRLNAALTVALRISSREVRQA